MRTNKTSMLALEGLELERLLSERNRVTLFVITTMLGTKFTASSPTRPGAPPLTRTVSLPRHERYL